MNRWYAILMYQMAVLWLLLLSGCNWAKFSEQWKGPEVKADQSSQFMRIGTGTWIDQWGKTHTQPIYIKAGERGDTGAHGETGPAGKVVVTLDRPIDLEKLPAPKKRFDANGGNYTRTVEAVAPIWSDGAQQAVSGVEPFKAKVGRTPAYNADGSVDSGGASSFLGGEMATWRDTVNSGTNVLIIFGGLALLGGIVIAVWAGRVVLGLAVAGGGVALIATGVLFNVYPWVVLIGLAAVLGLGVWYILDAKGFLKAKDAVAAQAAALAAVVKGVEKAPPEAQAAVKPEIAKAAGTSYDKVKAVITAAKTKAGI